MGVVSVSFRGGSGMSAFSWGRGHSGAWEWLWTLGECTIQEPPPLMHECTNLLPTWIPCAIIIIIIIIMLFWEVEEKASSLLNSWVLTPLLSSASLVSVPARIQWFASFLGRRKKKLRPPPPPTTLELMILLHLLKSSWPNQPTIVVPCQLPQIFFQIINSFYINF